MRKLAKWLLKAWRCEPTMAPCGRHTDDGVLRILCGVCTPKTRDGGRVYTDKGFRFIVDGKQFVSSWRTHTLAEIRSLSELNVVGQFTDGGELIPARESYEAGPLPWVFLSDRYASKLL